MTSEELRDTARAFADKIEVNKGWRKIMPDALQAEFRSIVASLHQVFPDLQDWPDWKGVATGQAYAYQQAHKWTRKIQCFCEGQLAMDSVRGFRIPLP